MKFLEALALLQMLSACSLVKGLMVPTPSAPRTKVRAKELREVAKIVEKPKPVVSATSHALDDEASPMTVATRSILSLGSPLRNYTDEKDRADEQAEVLQASC